MSDAVPPIRPRYSSTPLPPYSYVSGHAPHPVSDPAGHMHGQPHVAAAPLRPEAWRESEVFRYGVDLFNHGFYWEAHEAWESLWHAAGREGPVATWLKALIKLTASCVKAREGNPTGASRHARRSLELVGELRRDLPASSVSYCGVRIHDVEEAARELDSSAASDFARPQPKLVLPVWLKLDSGVSSARA